MKKNIIFQNNDINEIKSFDNNIPYEYQKYYLIKENSVYKFIISKESNNIIIRCKNYENKFNINILSKITKNNFHNINKAYEYIIDIFEKNKVIIKDININNEIKLLINNNIEKETEIILIYKKNNKSLIKNKLNNYEIKNEINYLKEEIKLLRKEIKNLNNDLNPKNIKYVKNIINDSFSFNIFENFSVFKSIDDILYLIYTNSNKSIISYNLINNKKINEIKNAHNEFITSFRHYLDIINKRDLIISISEMNNNIKLWNIKNFECLLNIVNINNMGRLYSACFLNDNNNQIYILTSNGNDQPINYEPIKIYDLNGNKIKEINNSNEKTNFIDTFYDNNLSKYYIITGNDGYIKSYDYNNNKLYHKYLDNDNSHNVNIIINDNNKNIKLIESSNFGDIRIWNFHSGKLLKKLKISNYSLFGICLWDNEHIFVGCGDRTIKLIDINNNLIIKNLISHDNEVCTIKKFNHPKYGMCLISQGLKENNIKLWINKKI